MTDICEHGSIRRKCPNCENTVLTGELDTIYAVLSELVCAVDEQSDGLDPTVRLVQAMKDAKSWVEPRTTGRQRNHGNRTA